MLPFLTLKDETENNIYVFKCVLNDILGLLNLFRLQPFTQV